MSPRFRLLSDAPHLHPGDRSGRLLVLSRAANSGKRKVWLVRCDCGVEKTVLDQSIRTLRTQSCGCLAQELAVTTDGVDRSTRTYRSWADMLSRCRNPSLPCYRHYGGRGISFDPRWETYSEFLSDMGEATEGMTIERADVNGNYTKENCRWVSKKQQTRNRRTSRLIEYRGRTQCVAAWCEELGLPENKLRNRIRVPGYETAALIATINEKELVKSNA